MDSNEAKASALWIIAHEYLQFSSTVKWAGAASWPRTSWCYGPRLGVGNTGIDSVEVEPRDMLARQLGFSGAHVTRVLRQLRSPHE